jgi:hypothetical protein
LAFAFAGAVVGIKALPNGTFPGETGMTGKTSYLKAVEARKLMAKIEADLARLMEPFIFEPNDEITQRNVASVLSHYLNGLAMPPDPLVSSVSIRVRPSEQEIHHNDSLNPPNAIRHGPNDNGYLPIGTYRKNNGCLEVDIAIVPPITTERVELNFNIGPLGAEDYPGERWVSREPWLHSDSPKPVVKPELVKVDAPALLKDQQPGVSPYVTDNRTGERWYYGRNA